MICMMHLVYHLIFFWRLLISSSFKSSSARECLKIWAEKDAEALWFRAPWTVSPEKCGVTMVLCTLTKHAAIFGSLWLQYRVSPRGIYRAVLPVREKTIRVIAIVGMCEKCSHFQSMMAVEEMKLLNQKRAKNISFITKKTSSDRRVGIHLSLHESCGNLHRHRSSAVVCLNEEFYLRVRVQY